MIFRLCVFGVLMGLSGTAGFSQEKPAKPQRDLNETRALNDRPRLVVDTQGFSSAISGLSFSPDDRYLAAAAENAVRLWDLSTGRLESTLRGNTGPAGVGRVTSVQFHPAGRFIAISVENVPVGEPAIQVYDLTRPNEMMKTLKGSPDGEQRLAFSRDGSLLAAWGVDHKLRVWDWLAGTVKSTVNLSGSSSRPAEYLGFPSSAPLLMFTQGETPEVFDALTGQSANVNDTLQFWEKFLGREDSIAKRIVKASTPDKVETASDINADAGVYVASGKDKVKNRDQYWAEAYTLEGPRVPYGGHRYFGTAVAMNRDCTLTATADALGEVHVWEIKTGKRRWKLKGISRPLFAAAFNDDGTRLAFGTDSYSSAEWGFNHCGNLNRTFSLATRTTEASATGPWRREVTDLNGVKLTYTQEQIDGKAVPRLLLTPADSKKKPTSISNPNAMCATLATNPADKETLVVVGQVTGTIRIYDTAGRVRGLLSGHSNVVTSLSTSKDGRFLLSSSMDGTIRLWPLSIGSEGAGLDVTLVSGGTVQEVAGGGEAERAGVLVGDRIVTINGKTPSQLTDLVVTGQPPFKAGEKVQVAVERKGKPLTLAVPVVAGRGEFGLEIVEPLLNLFLAEIDQQPEWVLWTEDGYFDSSAAGDRLVGWHRNQGWNRTAQFFPAHQFQRRFYRPDVINRVLKTGDVRDAVEQADRAAGRSANPVDLRERLAQEAPPTVTIVEPANRHQTVEKALPFKFQISVPGDEPVTAVKVLVNGRPTVSRKFDKSNQPSKDQPLENQIDLEPGENEITVIASNRVADSVASTVRVERLTPEVEVSRPRLVVLGIGVSKYSLGEQFTLQFAHADAIDFVAALEKQKGRMFSSVEKRVLTNEEATTERIRDELGWFEKELTKDDVGVLFLSAHGYVDEQQRYYLVPYDFDPDRLRNKSIPYAEFVSLLESARSRLLVMFADTCHSGGITGGKLSIDPYRELQDDKLGAVVFSSSLPTQESLENKEWGHGAFTRALLDIFNDKTNDSTGDGFLSLIELKLHLSRQVQKLTDSMQQPVTRFPSTFDDHALVQYDGVPTASLIAGTRVAKGDLAKSIAGSKKKSAAEVSTLIDQAKSLSRQAKFDEAIDMLTKVIQIDPKNALAYSRRGMLTAIRRDFLKAFADLSHAVELEPQDASFRANRGWGYFYLGDTEKALTDADAAIELDPKDSPCRQLRAKILMAQDKFEEALAEAERGVESAPKDSDAYQVRAVVRKKLGKTKEAEADFLEAIKLDPESSTAHVALGEFLYGERKANEAMKEFDRAIELNPDNFEALTDRAALFNDLGKTKEAIRDISAAIERGNRGPQIYFTRGMARADLGDMSGALADLNEAVLRDPSHFLGYAARGKQYLDQGRFDWAVEDLRRATERAPTNGVIAGNYTRALLFTGQIDEAVTVGKKASELSPGNYNACIGYVLALECSDRTSEAIKAFEDALKADPESVALLMDFAGFLARHFDPKVRDGKKAAELATRACELTKFENEECLMALADSLAVQSRFDEANKVLDRSPNKESEKVRYRRGLFAAKQVLTYDQLATVAESLAARGRFEPTIPVADRIIKRDPKGANGYVLRGRSLIELRRYREASEALETAVKLDPNNLQAINNLGRVLSSAPDARDRNGRRAVQILTRAAELTEYKNYAPLYFLANAHAEAGQFKEALEVLERCRKVAPEGMRGYFDQIAERLRKKEPERLPAADE